MAIGMTKTRPGNAVQSARPAPRWGDPGVSEVQIVKDADMAITPQQVPLQLQDSGILSEIQHHLFATDLTITPGTGTINKDVFGPYNLINWYQFLAGGNTPLISASGKSLGVLQYIEYPGRSWEANAVPTGVIDPLTNASDLFNFPAATGVFRHWSYIPLALRWAGMPGGAVGYIVLQNKKVANSLKASFAVTGGAAPYSVTSTVAGAAPYLVTGNATGVMTGTMETWKTLHTVPRVRSAMPVFGFVRYIQEYTQAFSGSSMTVSLEPGGMLLRALIGLFDATAKRGVATNNVSSVVYQYGTNRQSEVYTPQRNILRQANLYARYLPQGWYALDWYTAKRSLVDAKSTENTANVQLLVQFAPTYVVPANSQATIVLDKVYVARNRVAA